MTAGIVIELTGLQPCDPELLLSAIRDKGALMNFEGHKVLLGKPRSTIKVPVGYGRMLEDTYYNFDTRTMSIYTLLTNDALTGHCPLRLNRQRRRKRSPLCESWVGAIDPNPSLSIFGSTGRCTLEAAVR